MPALHRNPSCERLLQKALLLLALRCNTRGSKEHRDLYHKNLFARNGTLIPSERAETEQLHTLNVQDSKASYVLFQV